MKATIHAAFVLLLFFSVFAEAKDVPRGGEGFLYGDYSSFSNPGHFANFKAVAVDAEYSKESGNPALADMSLGMGNGRLGFGAFGSRSATTLTSTSGATDNFGVAIGAAAIKDKLTLGVGYSKTVTGFSPNNGNLNGSLVFSPMGMHGITLGVGGGSTMATNKGTQTQNATVAVGSAFKNGMHFEVGGTANNTRQLSDYNLNADLDWASRVVYFGAGYVWKHLIAKHEALARIGLVMGRFDASVFFSETLNNGEQPNLGGSLRVLF